MTTKEKLAYFGEKINRATDFNTELKNLIGIELFDFIQANDLLKSEFERRFHYLKNLADDKDFNLIQDNLFEVIQKIIKLTSLEEVQERQNEYNNKLINKLKNRFLGKDKEIDFLTLPELYIALQNKDNYYRLGDNSYFSPLEGEISLTKHTIPVKKQYEVNVEGFFREIFSSKLIDKENKKDLGLKNLLNEYNDYWYKFDELIYRIPIQLHCQSFEEFFFDCVEFYPRKGYEFHHNFFKGSGERLTETRLNKVKKNTAIVINDLIDFTETKHEIITEEKNKKMPNNVISNLKERYQSFIDEKEIRNFFFGLAEYVRYIENTPNLYNVIKAENIEKEALLKERDECEERTLQELMASKKSLLKIVKKHKVSNEELERVIKDFELFEIGKIQMSGVKSDNIEHYIWDMGKILYGLGYKEELRKFIDEKPKMGNVFIDNKNFVFSKSLPEREKLDEKIAELRKHKIWGCWDYLKYVPLFWLDRKGWEIVPINDLGAIDICFNLFELLRKTESNPSNKALVDEKETIANCRLCTKRIHLYLIGKLNGDNNDFNVIESNTQTLADQLNKSFEEDIQNFGVARAWFDAMSRATNNSQLEAYKQAVLQTLIWVEPFSRKLEERARLIKTLSKDFIMQNFEALAPILRDIEKKATIAQKVYNPKKNLDFFDKVSPEVKEAEKGNEMVLEITKLRERVEELSPANIPANPQPLPQKPANQKQSVIGVGGKEFVKKIAVIELKTGKYLLTVNDDYAGAKKIRKSKYYPIFIDEVSKRDTLNRTDNKKISDEMAEYFNHNKKCLVYMNGKYELTTVFVGNEDDREISWEVKTELIDEATYLKRLKKADKK